MSTTTGKTKSPAEQGVKRGGRSAVASRRQQRAHAEARIDEFLLAPDLKKRYGGTTRKRKK